MRDISRRGLLGGAAGIAVAAALPARLARAAAATPMPGAAAAAPLAGASINPIAYGVRTYVKAASIFDGYIGLPLAKTIQKVYQPYAQFGTTPPTQMTQLAPSGCQFLVSVEPSMTMTTAEQQALANWLAMLSQAGLKYRVVLFSEANNNAFPTAAQWQAYWSYYAPVIKAAGVSCGYDAGCSLIAINRAEQYYPSNPAPDELWMDYYATAFRGGSRLDTLIAMAAAGGVPAGIAEWGWSSGQVIFNPMEMPWWNEYCSYLTSLVQARHLGLGAIFFGSKSHGKTVDVLGKANDPRIPGVQQVANAVRAS